MMAARIIGTLLEPVSTCVRSFLDDENGSTAIEYSLIVGLIFLTIVSAVRSYSESTSEMYEEITTTLENAS